MEKSLNSIQTNDFKISPNFNLIEFECPCCWQVKLVPKLIWYLEKLHKEVQEPIYVLSGYRCKKHNKKIGGKEHSYHPLGMAADIRTNRTSVKELGRLAHKIEFPTVIVYPHQGFIHVDVREKGLGLVGG